VVSRHFGLRGCPAPSNPVLTLWAVWRKDLRAVGLGQGSRKLILVPATVLSQLLHLPNDLS